MTEATRKPTRVIARIHQKAIQEIVTKHGGRRPMLISNGAKPGVHSETMAILVHGNMSTDRCTLMENEIAETVGMPVEVLGDYAFFGGLYQDVMRTAVSLEG